MPEEEIKITAQQPIVTPTPVQTPAATVPPAPMPAPPEPPVTTEPSTQTAPAAPVTEAEIPVETAKKASILKVITVPAIVILGILLAIFIGYKLTSNEINVQNSIVNYDNKKIETVVATPKKIETEVPTKKIGR